MISGCYFCHYTYILFSLLSDPLKPSNYNPLLRPVIFMTGGQNALPKEPLIKSARLWHTERCSSKAMNAGCPVKFINTAAALLCMPQRAGRELAGLNQSFPSYYIYRPLLKSLIITLVKMWTNAQKI